MTVDEMYAQRNGKPKPEHVGLQVDEHGLFVNAPEPKAVKTQPPATLDGAMDWLSKLASRKVCPPWYTRNDGDLNTLLVLDTVVLVYDKSGAFVESRARSLVTE